MSEVTCKICGKSVSKRQTLGIGNNERACREHPETQALADKAQGTLKAQHQANDQRWQKKFAPREPQVWDPRPKCMVCDHIGLRSDEWFMRLLIEHQKYELQTGKPAFSLDPEEIRQMKGELADVACLLPIGLDVIKQKRIKLTHMGWQVAQLLNLAFVCADCVAKLDIPNPLPQPTFEQLEHMGVVAELMKPTLEQMAKDELAKTKITDHRSGC